MYAWLKTCCLLLAVVGSAAVASPPQAKTALMIYSPHGPEILSAARTAFEKKYPHVSVDWVYDGAPALYARLQRERSRPLADVWWGAPQSTFMLAAEEGLLEPYKPSWSKASPKDFHDPADFWYGDLQTPLTIFFSKRPSKSNAPYPTDWDDMLLPSYKSRIAARDPLTSGSMRSLVLALVDRQIRAGKTLDEAVQWMQRLDENIVTYTPHSTILFRLVGRGILPFGFWNAPEIKLRATEGFDIDIVYPKSGMPILVDGIALVRKKAIKPEAKAFYELVTSLAFAEKLTRPPFNRIHVREDLPSSAKPDYLKNSAFKVMKVDWRRIATEGEAWMQRLTMEVFDGKKLMQEGLE